MCLLFGSRKQRAPIRERLAVGNLLDCAEVAEEPPEARWPQRLKLAEGVACSQSFTRRDPSDRREDRLSGTRTPSPAGGRTSRNPKDSGNESVGLGVSLC